MMNTLNTKNYLGYAIEVVIIIFAAFGHYLVDIAPPEKTGQFAVGLSSFLTLCVFLFIVAIKRNQPKWQGKRYWILVSVGLVVITALVGVWYSSTYSKLTIGLPPENPEIFLVRGTEWTQDALDWLKDHPNDTPAEMSFNFGPYQIGRNRAWTEKSVDDARLILTINYVVFVLTLAATIFCLGEGVFIQNAVTDKINNWATKSFSKTSPTKEKGEKTDMTTILFVAADPTDAARLRLGEESREIQEKLQLAKMRDLFEFDQRWSVRPEDLSQALLDVKPQIVHFSGHGTSAGALCLEDQSGRTHPVEPDALEVLFELVADQVQCVVLNACYSEIQANAIGKHIPCVIGMNQAIGDKAAIAFAVGFYQALGGGRSIEDAYKFGCVQIRLQSIPEHLTPVLITKKG